MSFSVFTVALSRGCFTALFVSPFFLTGWVESSLASLEGAGVLARVV